MDLYNSKKLRFSLFFNYNTLILMISFIGMIFLFFSCKKEQFVVDSVYHFERKNLAHVDVDARVIDPSGDVVLTGKIIEVGPTRILKVGHIWHTSKENLYEEGNRSSFEDSLFLKNQTFKSVIEHTKHNQKFYITSYAINESGISFSDTLLIVPKIIELGEVEQVTEEEIKVSLRTLSRSASLVRYGHIWNYDGRCLPDNSGSNTTSFNFEGDYASFPGKNVSTIRNFDLGRIMYLRAYLEYNDGELQCEGRIKLEPEIVFSRYEVIKDNNNDKLINPGERVTLRVYLKNRGLIPSKGLKIRKISEFSEQIENIVPYRNINLSTEIIPPQGQASFDIVVKIRSNGISTKIPFYVETEDYYGQSSQIIDQKNNQNPTLFITK
jgi:hypothetical protein